MRTISAIVTGCLLAACGSSPGGNEPQVEPEALPQTEAANSAGAVERQEPGNGVNMVAGGDAGGGSSPCLMQGQERLQVAAIRAVGTEPFWGAKVEGRCVTYSTPEDQQGTRVWTRYSPGTGGGGVWTGQLGGKRFELRTRPEAGCSDGMSDKVYPIAAELTVNGEQRRGCAEPL